MSSARQTILQVRKSIQDATWDTAPNEKIVGSSVYITAGVEDDAHLPSRLPFALLNLGDFTPDEDDPSLITQSMVMILVTSVGGHDMNEHSIVGGPGRHPGSSDGRGILELEAAILPDVEAMTGADGTPIQVSLGSGPGPQWLRENSVVWKTYDLSAICTREDEFPPPSRFVATGGSGEVVMTWDLPASRYDLDSIILRYNATATAPTSETAGTSVPIVGSFPTGHTISLAADDYSFALFAKYIDANPPDAQFSSQVTGTKRESVTVS